MIGHENISDAELHKQIRRGEICFGGNLKLRIYGLLQCASGKRMKRSNRVFLGSVSEALENYYRPCGNCMRAEYKQWRNGSV